MTTNTLRSWNIHNPDILEQLGYLDLPITHEDWFVSEKYGDTSDWLNKPQYRIVGVNQEYLVFDETDSRFYVGRTETLEQAKELGEATV